MAQIDLHRGTAVQAMHYQTISTDTTTAGDVIDTAGYQSVEYIFHSDTISGGTFTPMFEESDTYASPFVGTAVSTDNLLGTIADVTFGHTGADDYACKKIGYVGKKRYVKMSMVTTDTANGVIGAVALLGNPSVSDIDALT